MQVNYGARILGLVAGLTLVSCPVPVLADGAIVVAQAEKAEKAHPGTGKVNSIDQKTGKANISHDPIKSLDWPAMTMDFQVRDEEGLAKIKPGDRVEFKVTVPGRGQYVITEIKPQTK